MGASIAIWWTALSVVFTLAWSSDAYTHIFLILPLTAALICTRQRPSVRSSLRRESWIGIVVLIAALLLRFELEIWNLSADEHLSCSMITLILFWAGSLIECFGIQALRELLFPFCFLALMIPFPAVALHRINSFLQDQSAWAASILFRASRIPVARDGVLLSIPGLDIEIASHCSSIRSSMFLFVITIFVGQLLLRSWWKKTLLIALSIPLSVAKNALRIFTIAELGTRVNPAFLDGWLHHKGGIIFFGLAICVTVLFTLALRLSEPILLSNDARFS